MSHRQIVTVLLAACAIFLAAGCERGDSPMLSSEADEPNFRQGQQLVKQGRNTEALASFLKVISKRDDSAPESHLEAGLLYLRQIKDPIAAIYHFRKYLELQPNSKQAVYVKGQIDAAKREFARTLPAAPSETQTGLDLLDQVEHLRRENDDLRAELTALRGSNPMPATRTRGPINPDEPTTVRSPSLEVRRPFINPLPQTTPAAEEPSPVTLAPETPEPDNHATTVQPAPTTPTRSAPTKPTPPAGSVRKHIVAKGDTLFSLAQKYYGDRSRWRDIYAANRDVLPSENSLRLGMEIKIP